MKITEKEFNAITGEETITERDETKEETKARLDAEKAAKVYAEAKAEQETKKAALLARLGLTEDELKTILG
jgi:predicted flap endonuclease-1-like 5' DNA nuclease